MADFVNRVSSYPVVADTCKVASDAYQWVKGKETLTPIVANLEVAATSLASMVKPVVDSNIAHKLDDVVCHQVLDRFESLCPTLKEASTEDILGPVANRALSLAETCADYCLPEDPTATSVTAETSRLERLSHIQERAGNQVLALFHSSVERAQGLLNGMATSTSNLTQNLSTSTLIATLNQVYSVLSFACGTAKAVSLPFAVQGLTTVKDQTEKLNNQLKESGKLNWIDLKNLIDGVEKLRAYLDEQLKKDSPTGNEPKPITSTDVADSASSKETTEESRSSDGPPTDHQDSDTGSGPEPNP